MPMVNSTVSALAQSNPVSPSRQYFLARRSSHYAQAHSLLNLQLIHSVVAPAAASGEAQTQATGFNIYSPLEPGGNDDGNPDAGPDFTAGNLLTVCKRLLTENSLPYFKLCREMGARAVDGLIRGKPKPR